MILLPEAEALRRWATRWRLLFAICCALQAGATACWIARGQKLAAMFGLCMSIFSAFMAGDANAVSRWAPLVEEQLQFLKSLIRRPPEL